MIHTKSYLDKVLITVLLCALVFPQNISAEETSSVTMEVVSGAEKLSDGTDYLYFDRIESRGTVEIEGMLYQEDPIEAAVISTDPSVLEIDPDSIYEYNLTDHDPEDPEFSWSVEYIVTGYGKCELDFTIGSVTKSIYVYVYNKNISSISASKADYEAVRLDWEYANACDGFYVYRKEAVTKDTTDQTPVAQVTGDVRSLVLPHKRNERWQYFVLPYCLGRDGTVFFDRDYVTAFFQYPYSSIRLQIADFDFSNDTGEEDGMDVKSAITEIRNTEEGQLVLWHPVTNAVSYQLLQSEKENGIYKPVTDVLQGKLQASAQTVPGRSYYYRLRVFYPDGEAADSDSLSSYCELKQTATKKAVSVRTKQEKTPAFQIGQYSSNWSSPDETLYYVRDGRIHSVTVWKGKLFDSTLNGKYGIKNTKTVKIGKYDLWGGFYYGEDDRFYIVVGFLNTKEKTEKTAVRVIQYDASWNRLGACDIKGGEGNKYQGIYIPFDAGNCRMAMKDDDLIVFMSRTMFDDGDGLHHQSNISFCIHTDTMTYNRANMVYTSHSFNQFIKIQNNTVYQLDHGDGFPRALAVTVTKDYDPERNYQGDNYEEDESEEYVDYLENYTKPLESEIYEIVGATGNNYTGVKAGGMEVGKDHILVVGTSTPQTIPLKGITGDGETYYRSNAFLIVTDKDGQNPEFQWLTDYDPKIDRSKPEVGETRIVKISDDRFMIMFSIYGKGQKLYCIEVDDGGNILSKKTYKDMAFTGATQPIFHNGRIFWSDIQPRLGFINGHRFFSDIIGKGVYNYVVPV